MNKKLCNQIIIVTLFVMTDCETNKGAREKLRFVWPDNHYPVICYSSIVWPYQNNHDMRDNSITLQTIEVTYSGWCDEIITIMLSFTTVFGANIRTSDQLSLMSLSCICKTSMVCQTLEQETHLSWRDQITTIVIFSRTIRQKQGQVTSRVWCGQIITIKLSVTKVEARDEQKIVQPDHHCHTICHDSVVRQTKEQGTNLVWCDQIITILSSAIPVLCDHIKIITICVTTVLHYKQLR